MADPGKIVLHGFYFSSCAWRVRLALAYKGIPFEYKAWNLSKGEHLSEEYKKINPFQLVPSMEIDGVVLNDSIVILEYLEERFPDRKSLLPKDLKERAAVRLVVNAVASGIQPLQNLRVLNYVAEKSGADSRAEWANNVITKGFSALEVILSKTAGKYCFGDEFTMADVVLIAQTGNAIRFKVDMEKFPTLQRVLKNLFELDFVQNSKPDCQSDYPGFAPS